MQILKLNEQYIYWSYEEYLNYLIKLKNNNDFMMLKKTLNANKEKLSLDLETIDYAVESIFVKRLLNFLRGPQPNLEQIRSFFAKYNKDINQINLDIDQLENLEKEFKEYSLEFNKSKNHKNILNGKKLSDEEIIRNQEQISNKINLILNNYMTNLNNLLKNNKLDNETDLKLDNPEQCKKLLIYTYKEFMILKEGDYFGDNVSETNPIKNSTVMAKDEDVHIAVIRHDFYEEHILSEKNKITNVKIDFIFSCVFNMFSKRAYFEKKFFSFFIFEEFHKDEIVGKEEEILEYVYFIYEGGLELRSKKNYLEIEENITSLINCNEEIIEEVSSNNEYANKLNNIDLNKPENKSIKESLKNKKTFVIKKVAKNDIFGIENVMFNFPLFYSAVVNTNKLSVFKIESKTFKMLIECENEGCKIFKNFSKKKITSLINRLYEIKKGMLDLCKNKTFNQNKNHSKNKLVNINPSINSFNSSFLNSSNINHNLDKKSRFITGTNFDKNKLNPLYAIKSSKEIFKGQNLFSIEDKSNNSSRISGNMTLRHSSEIANRDNKLPLSQEKKIIHSPNILISNNFNDVFFKKMENNLDLNSNKRKSKFKNSAEYFNSNDNPSLSRDFTNLEKESSDKFPKSFDTQSSEFSNTDKKITSKKIIIIENLSKRLKISNKDSNEKEKLFDKYDNNLNDSDNDNKKTKENDVEEFSNNGQNNETKFSDNKFIKFIYNDKKENKQSKEKNKSKNNLMKIKLEDKLTHHSKDDENKIILKNNNKYINNVKDINRNIILENEDKFQIKIIPENKLKSQEIFTKNCYYDSTEKNIIYESNVKENEKQKYDSSKIKLSNDKLPNLNKTKEIRILNLLKENNLVNNSSNIANSSYNVPSIKINTIDVNSDIDHKNINLPKINIINHPNKTQIKGLKTESTNTDNKFKTINANKSKNNVIDINNLDKIHSGNHYDFATIDVLNNSNNYNNAYNSLTSRDSSFEKLKKFKYFEKIDEKIELNKNIYSSFKKGSHTKEADFSLKKTSKAKKNIIMNSMFYKSAKLQLEKRKNDNRNNNLNTISSADKNGNNIFSMVNLNDSENLKLNMIEKFRDTTIYKSILRNYSTSSSHVPSNGKKTIDINISKKLII